MKKSEQEFINHLICISGTCANLLKDQKFMFPYESNDETKTNMCMYAVLALLTGNSALNDFKQYKITIDGSEIGGKTNLLNLYATTYKKLKRK